MLVRRWSGVLAAALAGAVLSGCSVWGGSSIGDAFGSLIGDGSPSEKAEAIRLEPIAQSIPQSRIAAGDQMGIQSGKTPIPAEVVKSVDLSGWDVAGLRFGMAAGEVSENLVTRGYTLEQGAYWRRSEDRVATEFGEQGLMRAMSTMLLPTEMAAVNEVANSCSAARGVSFKNGCLIRGEGASYEVSMAQTQDGWTVVRQMKIDRPDEF